MDNEEIIRKVLDGHSLRTFMVPDPAIPSNDPRHSETYDLPHVVIKGKHFWATSECRHLTVADDTPYANVSFCYTSTGDIFCSFGAGAEGRLNVMPKSRYEIHQWRLRKNYGLIWDSDGGTAASVLGDEIERGSKFKIAMLDAEDIWNVHPVDLPMYWAERGAFELKTSADHYPQVFRDPDAFLERIMEDEGVRKIWSEGEVALSTAGGFSTFYRLMSDGTYVNYYDISRSSQQQYKRLMVFSDNL
ncbi:MAG: hypothetical protein QGI06_02940 [Rhodospirillales bacterium]|jgi:hypothetical protein|nr:hypothetical protein [Rhodospirillales bacterium]